MASCELCGSSSKSLKKVKIEGTTLKVCESCSEMGKEVNTGTEKKKKKQKNRRRTGREEKTLTPDYGARVKKGREAANLSIKELADEMNEKKSVISKIEKEKFKPGKSLGKKLSKKLDVNLYTNPEVAETGSTDNVDSRSATMEDVADIS